jgi:hypothetical protein
VRLSTVPDDPGFAAWQETRDRHPRIILDGVEQSHCTVADEELGTITRCVLNAAGKIQADPHKPDEIWMEQVTGKVEIWFP